MFSKNSVLILTLFWHACEISSTLALSLKGQSSLSSPKNDFQYSSQIVNPYYWNPSGLDYGSLREKQSIGSVLSGSHSGYFQQVPRQVVTNPQFYSVFDGYPGFSQYRKPTYEALFNYGGGTMKQGQAGYTEPESVYSQYDYVKSQPMEQQQQSHIEQDSAFSQQPYDYVMPQSIGHIGQQSVYSQQSYDYNEPQSIGQQQQTHIGQESVYSQQLYKFTEPPSVEQQQQIYNGQESAFSQQPYDYTQLKSIGQQKQSYIGQDSAYSQQSYDFTEPPSIGQHNDYVQPQSMAQQQSYFDPYFPDLTLQHDVLGFAAQQKFASSLGQQKQSAQIDSPPGYLEQTTDSYDQMLLHPEQPEINESEYVYRSQLLDELELQHQLDQVDNEQSQPQDSPQMGGQVQKPIKPQDINESHSQPQTQPEPQTESVQMNAQPQEQEMTANNNTQLEWQKVQEKNLQQHERNENQTKLYQVDHQEQSQSVQEETYPKPAFSNLDYKGEPYQAPKDLGPKRFADGSNNDFSTFENISKNYDRLNTTFSTDRSTSMEISVEVSTSRNNESDTNRSVVFQNDVNGTNLGDIDDKRRIESIILEIFGTLGHASPRSEENFVYIEDNNPPSLNFDVRRLSNTTDAPTTKQYATVPSDGGRNVIKVNCPGSQIPTNSGECLDEF